MTKDELNKKLAVACKKGRLNEIKQLIISGADTNQLNGQGTNIFVDAFFCDSIWKTADRIKDVVNTMVEYGWDTKKFGLSVMHQFVLSTYDSDEFDLIKYFLQFDLGDDKKSYEELLRAIGMEESYQYCCEEDHDLENLFYALYEIVEAKMEGRNYDGIGLYYDAKGMKIDNILYLNDVDDTFVAGEFTEFNADIGFVCGDRLLVLRNEINILFMDHRIQEQPQLELPDLFKEQIIGCTITDISFDHKEIKSDTGEYGQPVIILSLDNGRKLNFSHNFGELPDNKAQSRFWTEYK